MDKDLKKIIKQIEANGYTVEPGGKHLKVKNATGGTVATLPTTPSGSKWKIRLETQLRRDGII